ncbi:resuscitation-promoting factor [Boudabousia marimammalium]|uniref:G5 domain-containing protein n=1 Tax=Boudabousia marimammalium TaxID=156892 RepID=A0A1Q5PRU2_9ACTO|nr:resuscitation-promoting factor [Boudabousia marimammalium]OKL50297.1 hypothetical protein BM477_02610 [Boudabousia marimammalium]
MPTFEHQTDNFVQVNISGEEEVAPRPPRRRSVRWIAAITALAFAFTGIGVGAASIHHPYKLDLDGTVLASYSWSGTVASALEDNNIELGEHDKVEPSLDTPLTDGMVIHVAKAKLRKINVDGETIEVWTTADTANQLLKEQEIAGRDAVVTASRGAMRAELPLVQTETEVPFLIGKESRTLVLPAGTTLTQALELANVTLGEHDTVQVTRNNSKLQVAITRTEFKDRVETTEIAFANETVNTDKLTKGQTRVKQKGVKGKKQITYRDKLVNGEVVSSEEIDSQILTQPVKQVTLRGTKSAPAHSTTSGAPAVAPAGGVWAALAKCESGGNPRAVSRNGRYHGLYQFSVSTWRSVGGSGLPSQASPAEQLQRAKILQARSGWGQWPACSRKIGVR